jgi:hypothetical protein
MVVINNTPWRAVVPKRKDYYGITPCMILPAVPVPFEVKIEMKNAPFKGALETFLVRIFPFFVYNSESLLTKNIVNNQ